MFSFYLGRKLNFRGLSVDADQLSFASAGVGCGLPGGGAAAVL